MMVALHGHGQESVLKVSNTVTWKWWKIGHKCLKFSAKNYLSNLLKFVLRTLNHPVYRADVKDGEFILILNKQ
jgi:hypothetical protein